jgi:O-antigen ligase
VTARAATRSTGGERHAPVVALGLAGGAATIGLALFSESPLSVPALVYATYAVFLFAVPVRWVPCVLLLVFVLLPIKYLPVPAALSGAWGPNLVGALVLGLRTTWGFGRARPWPWPALAAALGIWLVLSSAAASAPFTSLSWSVSFGVLAIGVAAALRGRDDAARLLESGWLALAAFVAAFAVVEAFVLHGNPLFGRYYENPENSRAVVQLWSVYRATTTLGHPLVNGVFLACAVPIALNWTARRRSYGSVALTALILLGLISTGSRGAVIAAALGGMVALAVRTSGRGAFGAVSPKRIVAGCLVGVLIIVSAGSLYLNGREDSEEGRISAGYRQAALQRGFELVREQPVFGSGPGTAYIASADQLGIARGQGDLGGALENSWLELAVATGLTGMLLVLALIGEAARRALAAGDGAVLGALAAYLGAAANFNWLEAYPGGHLILGLLMGWALARPARGSPGSDP